VRQALADLAAYDLVIFTSENAVEVTWEALSRAGRDAAAFGRARLAAIGRGTADALRSHGLEIHIMPDRFVAEALAAAVLDALGESAHGARVLLPRALEAREVLPDMLRAAGVRVDVVPVYQTIAASADRADELRRLLDRGQIDYVLLCSSSTVTNLCATLGTEALPLLSRTRLASIGPVTTEAAERIGLHVAITASRSTIEDLVKAVAADAAHANRASPRGPASGRP
jgi:uroporphyrinogen III methyltransferase/synthase